MIYKNKSFGAYLHANNTKKQNFVESALVSSKNTPNVHRRLILVVEYQMLDHQKYFLHTMAAVLLSHVHTFETIWFIHDKKLWK